MNERMGGRDDGGLVSSALSGGRHGLFSPLFPTGAHLLDALWLAGGKVGFLAGVGIQVVECGGGIFFCASDGEFPRSLADGPLVFIAPAELVMYGAALAFEEWKEVFSVQRPFCVGGCSCERKRGGGEVHLNHGFVNHFSGGDVTVPFHEEGNPDSAFPCLAFAAAERGVFGGVGRIAGDGSAVVADEADEGVVFDARLADGRGDASDSFVHRGQHAGVSAAFGICNRGESVFSRGCLHGGVNSVEGEVEEEGLIALGFDE